jgi:drug/metabolite transporter (DMT)-like permease
METRLASPSSAAFATLAVALSAVCFGLTPLFARELQATGAGPATIALYRYVFAAALLWPLLPLAPGKRRQGALLGLAGLMMGLGWIGYLEAVKAAPVSAAGVVYMSYPLFAILFARLLLGQKLTLRALGSAALWCWPRRRSCWRAARSTPKRFRLCCGRSRRRSPSA